MISILTSDQIIISTTITTIILIAEIEITIMPFQSQKIIASRTLILITIAIGTLVTVSLIVVYPSLAIASPMIIIISKTMYLMVTTIAVLRILGQIILATIEPHSATQGQDSPAQIQVLWIVLLPVTEDRTVDQEITITEVSQDSLTRILDLSLTAVTGDQTEDQEITITEVSQDSLTRILDLSLTAVTEDQTEVKETEDSRQDQLVPLVLVDLEGLVATRFR
jgi:hypothetical protein